MIEFFLILGALLIYFTPLLIAAWMRHPKVAYIGGLNAALGVTVIGWVGALMWALGLRVSVLRAYQGGLRTPPALNPRLLAVAGLVVGVAAVATIGVYRLQGRTLDFSWLMSSAVPSASSSQWQFTSAGNVNTAVLLSGNKLKQPTPFKSGPATLSVARGPNGYAVKLDADGDMACSFAPTASQVEVGFDDAPPHAFACQPAPDDPGKLLFDGQHSTAYLADPVGFLARLRNARHVRISSDFAGQTAPQVMDFTLPAGDPVAQISQAAIQVAPVPVSATAPAADAPAVAVAGQASASASPKAEPVARNTAPAAPVAHVSGRSAARVSAHHPKGYYLHPYRPSGRKAHAAHHKASGWFGFLDGYHRHRR